MEGAEEKSARGWRTACVALIAAAIVVFPAIAWKDFHTRGEAREAIVAQDMMARGEWILPHGYGDAVPSKPPLTHWFMAGVATMTGNLNEFAARAPSALFAALFAGVFAGFLTRYRSAAFALWVTALLTLSVEWYRAATTARVDMVFAATFALGAIALFRWMESACRAVPWAAIALFTGATLAKGPVAFLLGGGILLLYGLARGLPLRLMVRAGITIFFPVLALSLVWYVAAWRVGGDQFAMKLYDENVARFAGTMEDEPHKHSAFYLLGMLIVGTLPWSLGALWLGGGEVWRERGSLSFDLRSLFRRARQWLRYGDPWSVFSAVTCVVVVGFFLLPASKRGVYLLPAYPFIFSLLAERWLRGGSLRLGQVERCFSVAVSVLAVSVVGVLALLAVTSAPSVIPALREQLSLGAVALFAFGPVGWLGLVMLVGTIVWLGVRKRGGGVLLQVSLLYLVIGAIVLPPFGDALSERKVALAVTPFVQGEEPLYSFGHEFYGTAFYLHHRIFRMEPLLEERQAHAGMKILGFENSLSELTEELAKEGLEVHPLVVSPPHVIKVGRHVTLWEVRIQQEGGGEVAQPE